MDGQVGTRSEADCTDNSATVDEKIVSSETNNHTSAPIMSESQAEDPEEGEILTSDDDDGDDSGEVDGQNTSSGSNTNNDQNNGKNKPNDNTNSTASNRLNAKLRSPRRSRSRERDSGPSTGRQSRKDGPKSGFGPRGRGRARSISLSPPNNGILREKCKYFAEGKCLKGHDCPYSHELAIVKKRELCKFYLQGFCGKGDRCLFMHDEFPCKFYHTGAECYAGDKCRFSHQPLTEDTRNILRGYLDSGELPDDHIRRRQAEIQAQKSAQDQQSKQQQQQQQQSQPQQDQQSTNATPNTPATSTSNSTSIESTNNLTQGTNDESTVSVATTVATSTTVEPTEVYQPVKPVPKRHAILGDVTDAMRKSYYTWVWQQEMRELELAYTGTKRNLFTVEKPFIMTEKPPTPPPTPDFDDEDPDERECKIMSFYIDTLGSFPPPGDLDCRNFPPFGTPGYTPSQPPQITGSMDVDVRVQFDPSSGQMIHPDDPSSQSNTNEEDAPFLSFHGDEDLRIPPPGGVPPPMPSLAAFGLDSETSQESSTPNSNIQTEAVDLQQQQQTHQPHPSSTANAFYTIDTTRANINTPREVTPNASRTGGSWLGDSDDDDTADGPLRAALKRLQENPQQQGQASTASDSNSAESGASAAKKPKYDMAKMLSIIHQSTIPQSSQAASSSTSSTSSSSTNPSSNSDFWQNLLSTVNTGLANSSTTSTTSSNTSTTNVNPVPRDPRLKKDPRLKAQQEQLQLQQSASSIDSSTGESNSSQSIIQQPQAQYSAPHDSPMLKEVTGTTEFKLYPIDISIIDYTCYSSIYHKTDSRLKSDPRLNKFFASSSSSTTIPSVMNASSSVSAANNLLSSIQASTASLASSAVSVSSSLVVTSTPLPSQYTPALQSPQL